MICKEYTMKNILLLFAALLLITNSGNAQQVPGQMNIMVNGGLIQPFAPDEFTGGWKWGFTGGTGIGYTLSPNIIIIGLADYNYFLFDTYGYTQDRDWIGRDVNINGDPSTAITVTGNIMYRALTFDKGNFLYALAGAGVIARERKDVIVRQFDLEQREFVIVSREDGFSDSAVLVHAGIGYDFVSSTSRSMYFEVRYGIGLVSDAAVQYGVFKIGLRFSIR